MATTEIYTDGHTLSLHDSRPSYAVSAEFGTAGAAMLTLPEVYPGFAAGQFATSLFSRILGAAKPLLIGKRILLAATAGGCIARDGTIRGNVVDRPLGQ